MPPLTDLNTSMDEFALGRGGNSPAGIGYSQGRVLAQYVPVGTPGVMLVEETVQCIYTSGTLNPGSPAAGSAYPGTTWKTWSGIVIGGGATLLLTGAGGILESTPHFNNPLAKIGPGNGAGLSLVSVILSGGSYYFALPSGRELFADAFDSFSGTWFNIFDYFACP